MTKTIIKSIPSKDIRKYHKLFDAYHTAIDKSGPFTHRKYGFPLHLNGTTCIADPEMSHASGIVIDNLPDDLTGEHILDMGCGSGVLSIVAAYRKAALVVACDYDPRSIKLTEYNLDLNPDTKDQIRIIHGNLFSNIPPFQKFDRIIGNLWFPSLRPEKKESRREALLCNERFFNEVREKLKPGGVACLTASATSDVQSTEGIMAAHGITPHKLTVVKSHFNGKVDMQWHLYSFDSNGAPALMNKTLGYI